MLTKIIRRNKGTRNTHTHTHTKSENKKGNGSYNQKFQPIAKIGMVMNLAAMVASFHLRLLHRHYQLPLTQECRCLSFQWLETRHPTERCTRPSQHSWFLRTPFLDRAFSFALHPCCNRCASAFGRESGDFHQVYFQGDSEDMLLWWRTNRSYWEALELETENPPRWLPFLGDKGW